MSDDRFFDDNPVIDDAPASPTTLTVARLPDDMRSGEPLFVGTDAKIVRGGRGLELRPLAWRDRLWHWLERHPRLKAVLDAAAECGAMAVRSPRR